MAFSLDYVEHFKTNWFEAEDPEERIRLKELLYLDGLSISRDEKVKTPTLSPIFRYGKSKKTSEDVLLTETISNGGPSGT